MNFDDKQIEEIQAALLALGMTAFMLVEEVYGLRGHKHSESDALLDDAIDRLDFALKAIDSNAPAIHSDEFEVYRGNLYRRLLAGVRVETSDYPGATLIDGNGNLPEEPS